MCDPIQIGGDVLATVTGNPELIPLINGGVSTAENLAQGKSIGSALGKGAISGGEALAGQEVAGAFGVGGGNSTINSALGLDISPGTTGLPDIGSALKSGAQSIGDSLGITSSDSSAVPGASSTSPGVGNAAGASTAPASTGAAPATAGGPGVSAASTAAPGGSSLSDLNLDSGTGGGGGTGGSSGIPAGPAGTASPSSYLPDNFNVAGSSGSASPIGSYTPSYTGADSNIASAVNGGTNIGNVASQVAGTGTGDTGSIFSNILGKNASPLGVGVSALGLGANVLQSQKAIKGEKELEQQAGQEASQGNQLEGYLASGTLPPGLQTTINQATQSAKATIRSRYASMGMSGSSAEQQELAAADTNAQTQGAQLAMQLLQTGINESGMSAQLYEAIMNSTLQQDKGLSSSIANFAGAASGGIPAGRVQIG